MANGFSELNEPLIRRSAIRQMEQRKAGDDEAHMMDEDYIVALEHGMYCRRAGSVSTAGYAADRFAVIRDVILFRICGPEVTSLRVDNDRQGMVTSRCGEGNRFATKRC